MAKFDVTVTRIGYLCIEASSAEEALRLADGYGDNDVFEATDAQEEEG